MPFDPITAIATLGQVSGAAKGLYHYYQAWHGCEEDVRQIRKQLLWLCQMFLAVQDVLSHSTLPSQQQDLLESALHNCQDSASELEEILNKTRIGHPDPVEATKKLQILGRKFVYPFRKSTIQAIAELVELWQESFHFALSLLNLDNAVTSLERLSEIDEQIANGFQTLDDALEKLRLSQESAQTSTLETVNIRASETNKALDLNLAKTMDIDSKITTHHTEFRSWVQDQQASRNARVLVDALNPGDAHARYNQISSAHASTFQWIYEDKAFSRWLKAESGVFWISGKAGSGKSTLMKYIADQPKTLDLLQQWTGAGSRPHICQYYFWYAGTHLQKSREGLLRSLLYQILRQDAGYLASYEHVNYRLCDKGVTSKSMTDLLAGLEAITGTANNKFVFFIDGLDEFHPQDRAQELVDAISRIATFPNVKMVVSSRPWLVFERAFGKTDRKLHLENLTEHDIRTYVSSALADASPENFTAAFHAASATRSGDSTNADPSVSRLVNDVVSKSAGVFLWVRLVVDTLCERLRVHRSIDFLQRFVDDFPESLEDYYKTILNRIPATWNSDGALALKIMMMIVHEAPQTRKIVLLSFWLLSKYTPDFFKDPDFALNAPKGSCNQVSSEEVAQDVRRYLDGCCKDFCTVSKRSDLHPNERHDFDIIFDVNFLHRTVYDFLCLEDIYQLMNKRSPDHFKEGRTLPLLILVCSKSLPIGSRNVSQVQARQMLEEIAKALDKEEAHDKAQMDNVVPRNSELVAKEFGETTLNVLKMLESEKPDPEGAPFLEYIIAHLKRRQLHHLATQIEKEKVSHYRDM